MLRELHEISAEEQVGRGLYLSRGDAFHTKIITSANRIDVPDNFRYVGAAAYGPAQSLLYKYVAENNEKVPPEIDLVESVKFEEGAVVGVPWRESSPPFDFYHDVHTHRNPTATIGGIPVKSVKVE